MESTFNLENINSNMYLVTLVDCQTVYHYSAVEFYCKLKTDHKQLSERYTETIELTTQYCIAANK